MLSANLTFPEFQETLQKFMKLRGIVSELEAIVIAVKESFDHLSVPLSPVDFNQWRGSAKLAPENSQPRFQTDDALWG